tara:strand:+ start:225 stop:467 length:243 start_codon:yes stop_codon:yes gene_type:complete
MTRSNLKSRNRGVVRVSECMFCGVVFTGSKKKSDMLLRLHQKHVHKETNVTDVVTQQILNMTENKNTIIAKHHDIKKCKP